MTDGLTIATHYGRNDKDNLDYNDIEVTLHLDGRTYGMVYGDYYHDKGLSKSEGFEDAIRLLYPKIPVLKYNVADREVL